MELHCWAKEGLDTGPPLSPAWCACIARLGQCRHITGAAAEGGGVYATGGEEIPHHRHRLQTVGESSGSSSSGQDGSPRPLLRRLYLDTGALQSGHSGGPGGACISIEVLRQLVSQAAPSLCGISLAIRAASHLPSSCGGGAAEALAAMTRLRSLALRYEETTSGQYSVAGQTGQQHVQNMTTVVGALGAGPSAAGGSWLQPQHLGTLSPLSALTALECLSVAMSFPVFGGGGGGGSGANRLGSSPWCLQLLPSFPALTHLDLSIILQDCAPLLLGGPISWGSSSCLSSCSLQRLQVAALRVRGYCGASDPLCGPALVAICRLILGAHTEGKQAVAGRVHRSVNALRAFTLGLFSMEAAVDVPQEVWELVGQHEWGKHGPMRGGREGPGGNGSSAWTEGGNEGVRGFNLEFSSEGSLTAFGPPRPGWPAEGPRGLQLPLGGMLQWQNNKKQQDQACTAAPSSGFLGDSAPEATSDDSPCAAEAAGASPHTPPPALFPLSSLRVLRAQSLGAFPAYLLPALQLVLTPRLVADLALLGSLTALHLEFQTAAQQPAWARQLYRLGYRSPPSSPQTCGAGTAQRQPSGSSILGRRFPFDTTAAVGTMSAAPLAAPQPLPTAVGFDAAQPPCITSCSSSSLLLLVRGLPRLRSLYLRSCGTHIQTLPGGPRPPHASEQAVGADLDPGGGGGGGAPLSTPPHASGRSVGSGLGLGSVLMSSACPGPQDMALVDRPSTSWLRFDDEVALAAATSACAGCMEELHLQGLDMRGLTAEGLAALEGMVQLRSLVLCRAPLQGAGHEGRGGTSWSAVQPF